MYFNGTCYSFPTDPHKCDIVIAARKASGAFSFVGCIFIIFIIWLFKRYVVFAQRLILYLSLAAIMASVAYLMSSDIDDGPLCDFQAFWLTFFDWMNLLFILCLTFNLFVNVIFQRVTVKLEWLYIAICTVIPTVIAHLPFVHDKYGPAGAWCWIIDDTHWRIGIWYGPMFASLLLMMVMYSYIIYILSRKASSWEGTYDPDTERQHRLLKEDIKPLRIYPFLYLAISLFPLINRIQNAIDPHHHVFALVLLASISAPLHGALNAIVFGLDRDTWEKLRPSEIKLAFQKKLAPRSVVQEYPQPTSDLVNLPQAVQNPHVTSGGDCDTVHLADIASKA